jgi:hypothetical protein
MELADDKGLAPSDAEHLDAVALCEEDPEILLALRKLTPKKRACLANYALTGNVTVACNAALISRTTFYFWLKNDPDFAKLADDALEQAADHMEHEARRRAFDGWEEPVFGAVGAQLQDGKVVSQGTGVVGTVRKYSDTLLIFLLKGARPRKFRDNASLELTGKDGGPVQLEPVVDKLKARLEAILKNQAAGLLAGVTEVPSPGAQVLDGELVEEEGAGQGLGQTP